MNVVTVGLCPLMFLLPITAAHATGAELGPRGFGIVLVAGGALAAIQLVTLATDQWLPRHWPRARRWLVAILLPPMVLAVIGVGIALV